MFDYKLLAALGAVIEQGGFERAAQVLGLSQSAVSQRVKLLEARVGQPVLVRATPPRPTDLGRHLLNHIQQVRLLERNLQAQVPGLEDQALPERLRVAINEDSLATWWAKAVAPLCAMEPLLLELVVEDQDVGLKRMRAGEVAGCVCSSERPVAGARSVLLGAMRYRAVASASFIARYFADGVNAHNLMQAPAIVYGPDDRLQERFLTEMGADRVRAYHLCPSSEGFVRMVEAGLGWGMVPEQQMPHLAKQAAVQVLVAEHAIEVPLYWHYWRNGGALLERLTQQLQAGARNVLA